MRGQRHTPAAPYSRERPGTQFTGDWVGLRAVLDRCGKFRPHRDSIPRLSNPFWTGAENFAPTGIRSPDCPARRQSLYRLRYPAHFFRHSKKFLSFFRSRQSCDFSKCRNKRRHILCYATKKLLYISIRLSRIVIEYLFSVSYRFMGATDVSHSI